MKLATKKLPLIFSALLLVAFISLALMGPTHALGMQISEKGQMGGCVFDGMAEICSMSLPQHIGAWQTLLVAIRGATVNTLFAMLFLAAIAVVFAYRKRPPDFADSIRNRERLYAKYSFAFAYANPLREAFSQGILNSKAY